MRLWGWEGQPKDGQDKDPPIRLVNQAGNQAPIQPFWKAPSTLLPRPPNFASILLLGVLLGWHWARFTSLIRSAKIDGRGHVGKETVDEGWSDNFLIGKGFGQNLHTVPKMKNRNVVEKGKATALSAVTITYFFQGTIFYTLILQKQVFNNYFANINP